MQRTFGVIVAGVLASFAMTQIASGAVPKPVITQFFVTPSSLPSDGGTVQATAEVSNASSCGFEVSSYASSFGTSSKMSGGTCNYTFNVPANTAATTMYVSVTLSVDIPDEAIFGAYSSQQLTLSVAPNISNVTTTSTTTTTLPKTIGHTVSVPAGPDALLVVGPNVWVASCSANAVTEINATTHQVIQEITNPQYGFVCPSSLALVGNNIWVADSRNNSITVMNASNGAWVQTLAGPGISGPNIITPDGSTVWVASEYYPGAYPLSELDASGTFIGGVHGGPALSGPQCVVSTGTDIWVTDFGGLYEYNAHSGKYLKGINTGTVPVDISYHGGILWADSDTGINPLDEFSTVTGALVRIVPNAHSGGVLDYDGNDLFADYRGDNIEEVREYTPTGQFVKTLISSRGDDSVGRFQAMVRDGNLLWVANYFSQSVNFIPIN